MQGCHLGGAGAGRIYGLPNTETPTTYWNDAPEWRDAMADIGINN